MDIEEVNDRLEELQDTFRSINANKANLDMFKIVSLLFAPLFWFQMISAYCIERAKLLVLIYKYYQVRAVKE
jgi:hypothetical protein